MEASEQVTWDSIVGNEGGEREGRVMGWLLQQGEMHATCLGKRVCEVGERGKGQIGKWEGGEEGVCDGGERSGAPPHTTRKVVSSSMDLRSCSSWRRCGRVMGANGESERERRKRGKGVVGVLCLGNEKKENGETLTKSKSVLERVNGVEGGLGKKGGGGAVA